MPSASPKPAPGRARADGSRCRAETSGIPSSGSESTAAGDRTRGGRPQAPGSSRAGRGTLPEQDRKRYRAVTPGSLRLRSLLVDDSIIAADRKPTTSLLSRRSIDHYREVENVDPEAPSRAGAGTRDAGSIDCACRLLERQRHVSIRLAQRRRLPVGGTSRLLERLDVP